MAAATLFDKQAGIFVLSVGPVSAIRASMAKRSVISIIFFVILIGGILIFIATLNWISALLTVLFASAVAVWGQYWRDVDATARSFLQVAFAEIAFEMREQGIDPANSQERKRFDATRLTGFQADHWKHYQEYLEADDVQQFISMTP